MNPLTNLLVTEIKPGERVVMTPLAIERGLNGRHDLRTGVVVGRGRDGKSLRVVRDKNKAVRSYHMDFWQRA